MDELKQRFELLIGGIRIQSKKKKGIGTLACIVFDKETSIPLGLSNRHILKKKNVKVYQPRRKTNLSDHEVGIVFRQSKKFDCAVFQLDSLLRGYDEENSIYGLSGRIVGTIEPEEGLKVQKVGQFTGHTYGIVEKVFNNGTFKIKPNSEIPSAEISDGGDSGSLWVTHGADDLYAVGLHTGGEKDRKFMGIIRNNVPDRAWAIHASIVINELGVKF